MFRKGLGLLVAFLFITSVAFAAVAIQGNGVNQGVATTINVVGLGTSNDGSTFAVGLATDKKTAGATLTTADSGDVIVYVPTAPVNTAGTFNLPGAVVNMRYSFTMGTIGAITVNPQNSDTIRYLTMAAGEAITAPSATGDSVTLICDTTGYWTVANMFGSWSNGG